ncbi:MAG: 16S rRNA (cytosine(967)-C(5))-methyltransferase RsmB [Lachnospiraceae bacterium]|nr:16S rRNA (cytosine(967)-C(5))-methyltransferase RsmB [Lachnospiraceae bacterium]
MPENNSRETALSLVLKIVWDGVYFQEAVSYGLSGTAFSARDRAFIIRLVRGVIEKKTALDAVLGKVSRTPPEKMDRRILGVLYLGAYQLLFTDVAPYAAVNESIGLLKGKKEQGLRGFVNAVLRRISREKDTLLSGLSKAELAGLSPEIFRVFREGCGEEKADKIAEAFEKENAKGQCIRLNLSKGPVEALLAALKKDGLEAENSTYSADTYFVREQQPTAADSFKNGLFYIQDLGAALVVEAVRPFIENAGQDFFVLDACASPGGKTLHAADILNGKGQILSADISAEKIRKMDENIARSGFTNIRTAVMDAARFYPELDSRAGLVIADLPCTGLGVLREKPDIRLHYTEEKRRDLIRLQREMLRNLARYVKPGGVLLYATCTLDPDENEKQFAAFLEDEPCFRPLSFMLPGFPERKEEMAAGRLTLFPDEYPGGGFFLSLAKRTEAGT